MIFQKICVDSRPDIINVHHALPLMGISISRAAIHIPRFYLFQAPWCTEYKLNVGLIESKPGSIQGGNLWQWLNFYSRKALEKFALKRCDKIIVLSQFMKQHLIDVHRISEDNIEIVPGGVDISKFKPCTDKRTLRKQMKISEDKFVLLTVRRLVPRMGIENLIMAMSQIVGRFKDICLIIVGDGPLRGRLETLVSDLGLKEYIFLTGFIPFSKLVSYYQLADIFVLPTKYLEGFGLVTLEALACGIPVLGTPVGGTKEILGRLDQNLLFKGTNADSIAELIMYYADSPKMLDGLEAKCRQFVVDNYTWSKIIPKIEEIFLDICR